MKGVGEQAGTDVPVSGCLGLSGRAKRTVSRTPECEIAGNQAGLARKDAVWGILAATKNSKQKS